MVVNNIDRFDCRGHNFSNNWEHPNILSCHYFNSGRLIGTFQEASVNEDHVGLRAVPFRRVVMRPETVPVAGKEVPALESGVLQALQRLPIHHVEF